MSRTEMTAERKSLIEYVQEEILNNDEIMNHITDIIRPQIIKIMAELDPDKLTPKAIQDELFCQLQVVELKKFLIDLARY